MNWLIKFLGGYTKEEYYRVAYKTRLKELRERRDELQKILSDADNGRMIDKVSKRLNAVTNTILEVEK